ncbi:cytochrome c oxidase subunit II [Legionella clemsonensis]|uniref:Cytochrome aa3 subunit 2 n=1 Tax=Legionella clemsonensis TaxID=1867846 RepID=A0A222P019_9GAMM|nr:cytochrome c oxidase subunit II [Legionella clemsonensis]ASQ45179.1 Cytochrome c oxidase subunit 2 precursor [Legionella clemsonensis]
MVKSLTGLVLIIIFLGLNGCSGSQSIVNPASEAAFSISKLWWGMFSFFSLVFFAILLLWLYALRPRERATEQKHTRLISLSLIIGGGILLPSVTIFIILFFAIPIGNRILPHPEPNALRVEVIGHQWFWEIRYPDAGITLLNELHLPAKQPVDVVVTSQDVIHSFWIPRLNGKIDAIPGYINKLRLQPMKTGYMRGQCAEFCGKWHSQMSLAVKVYEPEGFKTWIQEEQKKQQIHFIPPAKNNAVLTN